MKNFIRKRGFHYEEMNIYANGIADFLNSSSKMHSFLIVSKSFQTCYWCKTSNHNAKGRKWTSMCISYQQRGQNAIPS